MNIEFLKEWQDLVGAALGPFLAVILSAIGFWIKSSIDKSKERAEAMRRIEAYTARALNDIFFIREKLKFFVGQLRILATSIMDVQNPTEFSLNTVNCPFLGVIYLDPDALNFRIRSYYLHNKVMWMDAEIKDINGIITNLERDFDNVIKRNDMIVGLMRSDDGKPRDASSQRTSYAENLEILAAGIEEYYTRKFPKTIESISQLKIYNTKVRKPYFRGFFEWWLYEGVSFKYFSSMKDFNSFARNLESIDRIDQSLEKEVKTAIENAEERGKKMSEEQDVGP